MKKLILLVFVALMFAGCLEKTFCQEIQPDVAHYFGNEVAARMVSMDENSPQMQFVKSFPPTGPEVHIGMCAYNSGKNSVSVIYQNSSNYAWKSVEEMAEDLPDDSRYNTSRVVMGGDYVYSYYEAERRAIGTDSTISMLNLRRGSASIGVVVSTVPGGKNYSEATMRDFALEVSRKLDRQQ